nr:hypothetical protein [uncultured Dongia sp.]
MPRINSLTGVTIMSTGFETASVRMEPFLQITVLAPPEDVDRIMAAVVRIVPLVMGKYDNNAFVSASGIERYRPLQGAAAGPEKEVRQRPGVVAVMFEIARDPALLNQIVEAIFQIHSYQEPLITVQEVLASRSKGMDDSKNPHRWWNTTGDWKKASKAV